MFCICCVQTRWIFVPVSCFALIFLCLFMLHLCFDSLTNCLCVVGLSLTLRDSSWICIESLLYSRGFPDDVNRLEVSKRPSTHQDLPSLLTVSLITSTFYLNL